MADELGYLLGIDANDPTQRLALDLVEADQQLLRRLVELRRVKGISQSEIGRKMGVTQPAVAAFERADADPKMSTLRRYALALGVLITHMLTDRLSAPSTLLARSSASSTGSATKARIKARPASSLLSVNP